MSGLFSGFVAQIRARTCFPFHGQTSRKVCVMGMPTAVRQPKTAMRIGVSANIRQSTEWSFRVVVFSPLRVQNFCITEPVEDFPVHQSIAETGIEAFAVTIPAFILLNITAEHFSGED
jgi:hypothetical protein